MALSAHVGSFTTPTATNSSYAITGCGFTPKWILLWGNRLTADGSAADGALALGAGTSSTDRGTTGGNTTNNLATTAAYATQDNTRVYKIMGNSATALVQADLVSLDSDGFTLNFSVVDASNAYVVNYLALGGADLTGAHQGADTEPLTAISKAVTGMGFTPKVLLAYMAAATFTADPNTAAASFKGTIGWGTATATQEAAGGGSLNGVASNVANTPVSRQVTTAILTMASSSSTISPEASLTSLDAAGFTLLWNFVGGSARYYHYTGLGGTFQVKVGRFTEQAGTGTQAVTGVGFTPAAVLFLSGGQAVSTTESTGNLKSFGAATSASARAVTWMGDKAMVGTANSVSSQNLDRTNTLKFMTPAGASPVLLAAADFVSNDADGFTVTWGTNDGVARDIYYLALGNAAVVPADLTAAPSQSTTASVVSALTLLADLTALAPAQATSASALSSALVYQDLTCAPAQSATASVKVDKTSGTSATGTGTGLATLSADTTHSVTWTTLTGGFSNTTGTETVIEALNSAGDGFRLGSLPAYGGLPFAALYELLGSGGSPTVVNASLNAEDPGSQVSLKTTSPDGHLHVFFSKTGTFVGTEDVQGWTRTELAPTQTAARRYLRATGTDSNGIAWTVDACVWPSGHIYYSVSFVVPSTISISVSGSDSFEICAPAGLLPAGGAGIQQGPWVAPGVSGFSGDTSRSFAGTVSTLVTTGGIPDGASSNTSGEPDFLAFLPSTVGNGGQVGTLADQVRGALVAKWTHWRDIFNYTNGVQVYPGGGYSSLANTNRVKAKWGASPTSLPAGTYTLYLMEVYSPLVTPAGAGTLTQARANMLAVVADYLQPGTPTVSLGTPSSLTYNGRATGCFRMDQGCYEVTATAAGAAAIQLDLGTSVQANIRYAPRFRVAGLPGTPQADGSDFRVLWGGTALTVGTDYTIAVDSAAGVAYIHLQRDVVQSGATGTQLTTAVLTLSPLVDLAAVPAQSTTASAVSALTTYRDLTGLAPAQGQAASAVSGVLVYRDLTGAAPAQGTTASAVSALTTYQNLTGAAPAQSQTASVVSALTVYGDLAGAACAQASSTSAISGVASGQDLTTAAAQSLTDSAASALLAALDLIPQPACSATTSSVGVLAVTQDLAWAPAQATTASSTLPFAALVPTAAQAATTSSVSAVQVAQDLIVHPAQGQTQSSAGAGISVAVDLVCHAAQAHAASAVSVVIVDAGLTTVPAQATTGSAATVIVYADQSTAPAQAHAASVAVLGATADLVCHAAQAQAASTATVSTSIVSVGLSLAPAQGRTTSAVSSTAPPRVGHIRGSDASVALLRASDVLLVASLIAGTDSDLP